MFKKISLLLLLACAPFMSRAQQTMSAKEMVAITPMVSYVMNMPDDARMALNTKLNQMVTQNGFGSSSGQFVLTGNVVVVDKQATATAPVQFVVDLEVSLYVVDVNEGVTINEMSFNVQGIDRLENKAIIQAIHQIKPKTPAVRTFMDGCRTKIIDYYNTRIPTLITKAKAMAERDEYYEALGVLSAIPECVDQYPLVADQMTDIYTKMIDSEALMAIQEAKGKIALKDYESAFDALLGVNPSSKHSAQAFSMIAQVKNSLDAAEQREYEDKLKIYQDEKEAAQRMHDDNVALTKMKIQAAQKVGVESAKTETSVMSKLNNWFLGKFK